MDNIAIGTTVFWGNNTGTVVSTPALLASGAANPQGGEPFYGITPSGSTSVTLVRAAEVTTYAQ